DVYGGGSTTLGLVATSVHPDKAGVQLELLQLLLDHGAAIDTPRGGGNKTAAVKAALHNGRPAAAKFLAERGAKVDLEAAAGVGDLKAVKSFFDAEGALKPPATQRE